MTTAYSASLMMMNAGLIVAMATVALWQWSAGHIAIGAVATAIPLAWQLNNIAGWVARSVTAIFENIGTVQDGMRSIDVPRQMPDPPRRRANCASPAAKSGSRMCISITAGCATRTGAPPAVLHGIDLTIAPGERVGLVGPSGAGKSTLVNLLLHFYAPASGRILIDGQDIAARHTGKPARAYRDGDAGYLAAASLHRARISATVGPTRPTRGHAAAARRPQAHDFIDGLEDWHGRRGYDAHVGERGVKLSGGQRQRIAIARVILKNAPILVLDEATSALDSEVEAAIQEQLDTLMAGPHGDRHRPPPVDHFAHGPSDRAGPRPHRRDGLACRSAAA